MSGTIVNGRRVAVEFGAYCGEAGVQDRGEGILDVAFFADARAMRRVESGTVAGASYEVVSVDAPGKGRAGRVPGMIVLTVRPVVEAGE